MRLIRAYRGISVSFLYAQQFIYQYLLDLGETPNPTPRRKGTDSLVTYYMKYIVPKKLFFGCQGIAPRPQGAHYLVSQRKTQKHTLKYIK